MNKTKVVFLVQEPNSDELQVFLVSKSEVQRVKDILSKNLFSDCQTELAKHGIFAESIEPVFFDPVYGDEDNI